MSNQIHFQNLVRILNSNECSFLSASLEIEIISNDKAILSQKLSDHKIESAQSSQGVLINTRALPYKFFWQDLDFRRKLRNSEGFNTDYGIYNQNGLDRFWDNDNDTSFTKDEKDVDFFFQNIRYQKSLLKFLESESEFIPDKFHFVDYFDSSSSTIIFTSNSEPGKLILYFPDTCLELDDKINFEKVLPDLKDAFSEKNKNLPVFIKSEIYRTIFHLEDDLERVNVLLTDLSNIIKRAKVNFYVYLNDLSIDEVKKQYSEFKSNFFEDLSIMMGKLTSYIVAFPITSTAAIYGIIKFDKSPMALILISLSLLIASIYISIILRFHRLDLKFLDRSFQKEYNDLIGHKFFTTHKSQKEDFRLVFDKFRLRAKHLNLLIGSYLAITWVINVAIIVFAFYNLYLDSVPFSNIKQFLFSAIRLFTSF